MRTHIIDGLRIRTEAVRPPIPVRDFDWCAVLDNYDGAPDAGVQPVGTGINENAAIADLLAQVKECA